MTLDGPPTRSATTVPRPFEPDWDAALSRVVTVDWAREVLVRVREDFEHWHGVLRIPGPGTRSEWTHHFFCPVDGARLTFDPASPSVHVCPRCGRVATGDLVDGAWRTHMHNAAAAQAQRAALLVRLVGGPDADTALAELTGILHHYASQYDEYEPHGQNVGLGRVTPQNLDESIWAIALLRAARWAEPALSGQARADAARLAASVAGFLEPQLGMVHNIHCWIVAALAECAARTGDTALLERACSGPFGAEQQIRQGFRAEGLWFEVSAFYHYYTVAALLSFCEAGGGDLLSPQAVSRLASAISEPPRLAYADGRLPAYGDCWPDVRLGDFAADAAVAAAVLPGHEIDVSRYSDDDHEGTVQLWIGSRWDAGPSRPMRGRRSVAELVFGVGDAVRVTTRPERPASFLWPDVGIAVLSSDIVRLAIRFGPDSGWHDHHDKLGVDVETTEGWRSLDLGTSGYGADFTDWMRSPAAHDIGIVHDEEQPPLTGRLEAWSETRVVACAQWDDRRIRRSLELERDGWSDVVELSADTPGVLTWVFHGDGQVLADAVPSSGMSLAPLPGHEWLRAVRLVGVVDGRASVTWDAPGAPRLELDVPAGFTVSVADADGNPSDRPLGVVVVRGHAAAATVRARFTLVRG